MIKTKQIFNIRETADDLIPEKLGRTSYVIALLIALLMGIFITIFLHALPMVVPVFFTLPWGETRLAPKLFLYLFPGIILVFVMLNLGLGKIATKLSPILPKILAATTAVVAAMLLIALFGIVQSLVL